MALVSFKWIGMQQMMSKLAPANMVKPATNMLLRDLTHAFERDVKKATVVGTPESTGIPGYVGGRARASIVSNIKPMQGEVSTNVKYYPYIETKPNPRHMEGSGKVLGEGAFHYVAKMFKSTATNIARRVAVSIESNWGR